MFSLCVKGISAPTTHHVSIWNPLSIPQTEGLSECLLLSIRSIYWYFHKLFFPKYNSKSNMQSCTKHSNFQKLSSAKMCQRFQTVVHNISVWNSYTKRQVKDTLQTDELFRTDGNRFSEN